MQDIILYGSFVVLVLVVLVIDMFILGRKTDHGAHGMSTKQALVQSACFIGLGVLFMPVLYWMYKTNVADLGLSVGLDRHGAPIPATKPGEAVMLYFQAWLLEYTLSVDNLFIFAIVFSFFKVPEGSRHRVLFWGIIGAMLMRGVMIGVGTVAIQKWHWVLYVFGGFLVLTAVKLALQSEDDKFDPKKSWIVRLTRAVVPMTEEYDGEKFFTLKPSKSNPSVLRKVATPLFLVLVIIEGTDLVFAIDSIPAAFAVAPNDPFIVFTSNIFAILGLRSLYFALQGVMSSFWALKYALAAVLAFIGVKMLIADGVPFLGITNGKIPAGISLGVVVVTLVAGVVVSIIWPLAHGPAKAETTEKPPEGA